MVAWLRDGRGDALRHLGWMGLVDRLAEHLRTDMARARVQADQQALFAALDGRLAGLDRAAIADEHGSALVAALDRLPAIRPLADIDEARARLDELLGVEAMSAHDGELASGLDDLEDLDESLAVAAAGGVLSVVELIGVAELCRASASVARSFTVAVDGSASHPDPGWARGLRQCAARLRSVAELDPDGAGTPVTQCPDLLAELDRAIDRRGDEPQISAQASPALAEARNSLRAAKQRLQAKAEALLRNPSVADSLRDRYVTERDGRLVLPVRSDRLGAVRSGGAIIHGSSATGHTFYVEPASLVQDNNALREAELAVSEEERKILQALSAAVAERSDELSGMQRACLALDFMLARLRLGQSIDGSIPQLVGGEGEGEGEDGRGSEGDRPRPAIELRAARHPAMLLDGIEVVPNDLVLDRGHALVISGPNAGGKTVALKTLGILALMAAAGLALPCEGIPRIPVFSRIITDVGDDQSITANLSTFSAHIGHVIDALAAAGRAASETLVLLDEVAVGTDPEQGAALAEAILIELVDAGATAVVTTHYDRLKLLATQTGVGGAGSRFHNAAVGFDLARLRPTFRLSLGVPGSSSAIAVARRLGLSESVLTRAEALLGDEGVKIDELLRDIEAERQSLARTRERLEREQQRLRQRDHEVRSRERRVLEGVRSRRAKAYAAAAEQLRELELELKHKRKRLRRSDPDGQSEPLPTRAELAGPARAKLAAHRAEAELEAQAERGPDDRVDPRRLAVGDRVRIPAMKQDGEVVAISGSPAKKVTVQLPNLRTTVKVSQLAPPVPEETRARVRPGKATPILDFQAAVVAQAEAHFGETAKPVKAGFDNECDVRGQRFEDASERVTSFVAEALARDQDIILIRHGHGGGALRKAVREALTRSANVRRQRPGLSAEGGDAVTVAWIE